MIPKGRIFKRITELTGLTRAKLAEEGMPIDQALLEFRQFDGDLPMVAYNAPFDHGFLKAACAKTEREHFKMKSAVRFRWRGGRSPVGSPIALSSLPETLT